MKRTERQHLKEMSCTNRLSEEDFNEPIERAEATLVRERERLAVREVGDAVVIA